MAVDGTRALYDYQGVEIRLTDERLAHILDHPEMVGMESEIPETLGNPESVVRSISDEQAHLYYRPYRVRRWERSSFAWWSRCSKVTLSS